MTYMAGLLTITRILHSMLYAEGFLVVCPVGIVGKSPLDLCNTLAQVQATLDWTFLGVHGKSVGLPEISRATWRLCDCIDTGAIAWLWSNTEQRGHFVTRQTTTWASYQIHKIAGCACAGNAGNVFPRRRLKRKPLVSDPGMHHGTCVTHVPWCMSGSLTCGDGENVPGIPGACAPAILRIWQEAHVLKGICEDGAWFTIY